MNNVIEVFSSGDNYAKEEDVTKVGNNEPSSKEIKDKKPIMTLTTNKDTEG